LQGSPCGYREDRSSHFDIPEVAAIRFPVFCESRRGLEEKYGASLDDLLAADRLKLQTALIPVSPYHAPLRVYRMTQAWPTEDSTSAHPKWATHECPGAATPVDAEIWDYLFEVDQWSQFTQLNRSGSDESVLLSTADGAFRVSFYYLPSLSGGVEALKYVASTSARVFEDRTAAFCGIQLK
jgi:hypothetical protein